MKPYLLIGAGFSRNWGGWLASEVFEFLLGDTAITRNTQLRDLLWKHQQTGGFEAALDELRKGVQRDASQQTLLVTLESAVGRMFDAMNIGYDLQQFEFRHSIVDRHPLQSFLSRLVIPP